MKRKNTPKPGEANEQPTKNPKIDDPYYAESPCQAKTAKGSPCTNKAYFSVRKKCINGSIEVRYLCGQHSKKDEKTRVKLPKNPNEEKEKKEALVKHAESTEKRAKENASAGKRGSVKCFHMSMMGVVPLEDGRMNVFPNRKHGGRKDGYGCSSLSPMMLGPVIHRQPNLPIAQNIENYHQFNKVWSIELDNDTGEPSENFYKTQRSGYKDKEPHRHKFDAKTREKMMSSLKGVNTSKNENAPVYSIHETLDGEKRKFSYVESRYFYCSAYEALVIPNNKEYTTLVDFLDRGYDITICGYDAYDVTMDIYDHYCDESKPFGHELVLYTLLTTKVEQDYPWHTYRKSNPDVYENIACVEIPSAD